MEGKGGTGERYNSKCLQPSVKHGGVSAMNWSGWESCKNEWKYKCRQAASDFNHHAIPLRKQPTGNIVHFFFSARKTQNKTLSVMEWPPQSLDCYIITARDHPDRK